jgi:hypothetical protein
MVNSLKAKIPHGYVKFKTNDHVRITKEKVKFAKGYYQNCSTKIFRVLKIINHTPQPVYQLADLNNRPIRQFYNYALVKDIVSPQGIKSIKFWVRVITAALNSTFSSGKGTGTVLILG